MYTINKYAANYSDASAKVRSGLLLRFGLVCELFALLLRAVPGYLALRRR